MEYRVQIAEIRHHSLFIDADNEEAAREGAKDLLINHSDLVIDSDYEEDETDLEIEAVEAEDEDE